MKRRRRHRDDGLSGLSDFSDGYFTRWGEDDPGDRDSRSEGLRLRPGRREVPSRGLRPWWWWIARLFR